VGSNTVISLPIHTGNDDDDDNDDDDNSVILI